MQRSALFFLMALTAANAQASDFSDENATLYIETTRVTPVLAQAEGRTQVYELPQGTLLSFNTAKLVSTLQEQNAPTETMYCGLHIVDVQSDELRDEPALNTETVCVSMNALQQARVLETNADAIRDAGQAMFQTGAISQIEALATDINGEQLAPTSIGALTAGVGSPLSHCARGCLYANSEFGYRIHPVTKKRRLHKGIDLRAGSGTAVVAALPGRVLALRTETNAAGKMTGYGHYVILAHPSQGMETLYAHLSSFRIRSGASVSQGTLIASSGNTGLGTGPHLHFETHRGSAAVNPRPYLRGLLSN